MFPWSASASNAALAGGIGSKALSLTSDQEKDVLALNSNFGDPKEDEHSTAFLQGGRSSDVDDVEEGEEEKLAVPPCDVNPKFSILLNNDTFEADSEKTSSEVDLHRPLRPTTNAVEVQPQAKTQDASLSGSQNIVLQLVNSVNWDELGELLDSVWVRPRNGTNGDVSTRRGEVTGLQRQHVALSCKNLVEKLKLVMSYQDETSKPKDAAADVIAWILQDGVSLNFEASALANDMLVFAQSSCMPVSRAGLRALRNLVVQSVMEYREVVLKHPHFSNLFERIDAESYIYVCEMVSHIANSARAEAACSEFFQAVCNVAINPIVGILSLHETWPKDKGILRWTIVALITLRCTDLVEKFANDPDKLDIVWKIIDREASQGAHELAMELLAALISSGDERILTQSVQHISRLFDVLCLGTDHFELNALKVAQNVQTRQMEKFGSHMGIDHLTKIQLVLESGAREHQNLCLSVLFDLLAVKHTLLFSSCALNLIKPVVTLLSSEAVEVQRSSIDVLRSMIRENGEAVMEQAEDACLLGHLVALLQTDTFADCEHLYEIVTWFAENKREDLSLEQDIVCALVENLTSNAVERRVVLPSFAAVLHESQASCEEAVKAGLVGHLVHALSDGNCIELKGITRLMHSLLHNSTMAVSEVHNKYPTLVQALLRHIDTADSEPVGGNDVPLISLLVSSLVAVLVTGEMHADFATSESLRLLANLLTSGKSDQEEGAIQLVKASINWFSMSDIEESEIVLHLCKLLPKYVDQNGGEHFAQCIMFVVGYMGQSKATMVADSIMKLRETVADKAWEAVLGMTDGEPVIHNGIMRVLKELRQHENQDNFKNLEMANLEIQIEVLKLRNQELLLENQTLIGAQKDLEHKVGDLFAENDELHDSVERLSAQVEMGVTVPKREMENELRAENGALKEELVRKQRCIEELETERAVMEEGARVMKEGMEQQHSWIETLKTVIESTGGNIMATSAGA